MIEFVGRIEDGMPELEAQAHAWLPGPRSPAVIYTHRLTIALMDDSGDVSDSTPSSLAPANSAGWKPRTTPGGKPRAPAGKPP